MKSWGMAKHPMVKMANPQSAELTHLRPSLLPNLLELTARERRERTDVRIFEVGTNFYPQSKDALYEFSALGIVLAHGSLEAPKDFVGEHAAYFEAKGVVEALLEGLGITSAAFRPLSEFHEFWAEGRSAEVIVDGIRVGIVGELAGDVQKKHKDLGSVAMVEFDLDKLANSANAEHEYRVPSKFPEVMRDVAVLVPLHVTADDVNQLIVQSGPTWLRDVDLFDYYEGDQVADGQKSLAFRLMYQSDKKTLTDRDVNDVQKEIEAALRDKGWEIR